MGKTIYEAYYDGIDSLLEELKKLTHSGYSCVLDDIEATLHTFIADFISIGKGVHKDLVSPTIRNFVTGVNANGLESYLYHPSEAPSLFPTFAVGKGVVFNNKCIPILYELPMCDHAAVRFFPTHDCKGMIVLSVFYDPRPIADVGVGMSKNIKHINGSVLPLDVWQLDGALAFARTAFPTYTTIREEGVDEDHDPYEEYIFVPLLCHEAAEHPMRH